MKGRNQLIDNKYNEKNVLWGVRSPLYLYRLFFSPAGEPVWPSGKALGW